MIKATVDISGLKKVENKLKSFSAAGVNTDKMLRSIATSLCALIRTRVHEDGIKSDGSPIGVYSPAYLKQRAKKKLLPSTKVVLAYTLEMQKDFGIGATNPTKLSEGGYGLGFKNPLNVQKHQWNKLRYGNIYNTTTEERGAAVKIANRYLNEALKQNA